MIKILKSNKGTKILVSDKDYDRVKKFKWKLCPTTGILFITKNRKRISLHRFIMNPDKDMVVDHINGDRSDNRRSNLRVCSHKQNLANQKLNSKNTSGFKGVYYKKSKKKFTARIKVEGRLFFLGHFNNPKEAGEAYDRAAVEYFGGFAKTNKSLGLL